MMFFVLLILLFIQSVETFSCYECSSSSYRTCDVSTSTDECEGSTPRDQSNKCYWLTYTKSLGRNKDERFNDYGFLKGCVPPKTDCRKLCDYYLGKGYEECKVQCCEGDLCNKDTFVRVFERRTSKRSSSSRSKLQTNGSTHSTRCGLNHLFITCLTLLYYCLYKLFVVSR